MPGQHKHLDDTVSAIIEASPIGMVLVGSDGRIVFANRRCEQLFGYAREHLNGMLVEILVPERFRSRHTALREGFSEKPVPRPMGADYFLRGVRDDGGEFPIEVGLSPIHVGGDPMVLASILDVSDSARIETLEHENRSLKQDAGHDDLTGLPNRRFFMELLSGLVSSASRRESSVVLMFVDLDHFKEINDHYGHAAGDRVLKEVAGLLRDNVRSGDVVARFGGDEFLVCLVDTRDSEAVTRIMDNLIKRISETTSVGGPRPISVTASIGAVCASDLAETTIDELIRAADLVMYEAKQAGGNQARLGVLPPSSSGAPLDPRLLRKSEGGVERLS